MAKYNWRKHRDIIKVSYDDGTIYYTSNTIRIATEMLDLWSHTEDSPLPDRVLVHPQTWSDLLNFEDERVADAEI